MTLQSKEFWDARADYNAARESRFIRRRVGGRLKPAIGIEFTYRKNSIAWRGDEKMAVMSVGAVAGFKGRNKTLSVTFAVLKTNASKRGTDLLAKSSPIDMKYVIRGLHRRGFRNIKLHFFDMFL